MKPSLPFKVQSAAYDRHPAIGEFAALLPRGSYAGIAAYPTVEGRSVPPSPEAVHEPDGRRTKIWQLGASLHCSIIGTCLTNGELRTLLQKFKATSAENPSDHDLHGIAVAAAGKHDLLAKQIQKALDRRHGAMIHRFAKAGSADELHRCWDEARRSGDIPGGYWAVLTHPFATEALVHRAFGDVHMLSHLVGAANRADIRRLHQLEEEKTALEAKLARQQAQLRDGIVTRDAKIRQLHAMLTARIENDAVDAPAGTGDLPEVATLNALIVDLRKQLDAEVRRRERAEKRAGESAALRDEADRGRHSLEREFALLQGELEAAEAGLAGLPEAAGESGGDLSVAGVTILYVGGRPHQVARLKSLIESASGQFIHHDGGIEERRDLLRGLVSRADAAFFPVDCVSHDAAQSLKRLCQQAGKPFIPLRSAGIASLLQALRAREFDAAASRRA
jgi:hypothetical protein